MGALLNRLSVSTVAATLLFLAGCSQANQPVAAGSAIGTADKSASQPAVVTAKTAFWPMVKFARAWSADAVPIKMTPKEVPGFAIDEGKAAEWQMTFGSAIRHQYRVYTYAVVAVPPDIQKGVTAGFPKAWAGQTRDAMPIDVTAFLIDSDAAYKTAAAQAAAWIAKNPGKPPTSLELGSTYALHAPVWYIAWGTKQDGYIALVNASTGGLFKNRS